MVESYGKWLCTRDTTGLPYKEMLKISPRSVKNVKGEEMRYILATKASTQLWHYVLSITRGWIS